MFLLILESLGSTELFFILIMALVFFGPRKLPQLSRTLGKNLAEFRRASEDFKRTWEREVAMEDILSEPGVNARCRRKSIIILSPVRRRITCRSRCGQQTSTAGELSEPGAETSAPTEAPRKHDWL